MKSKIIISSVILSVVISGCDKLDAYLISDKYQLKDTWGEDGNWGKVAKKPAVSTEHKEAHTPVVKHEEPKHEEAAHEEPKHEEAVHEEPKAEEPKTEEASTETQTASTYENDKFGYAVAPMENWQQKDTFGAIGAYYIKEKEGDNLNFSVGAVKNLKESDLNTKFKEEYLKKLKESFPGVEIISTKDDNFKGHKAWAVEYNFDKNGKKLHQKQVFIPHKDATLVINWVASESGFFKGEEDFSAISKNLEIK